MTTHDIKRPRLFEPFFNEEILPDNSFLTYIYTTGIKNSVTLCFHSIKKSLKTKKFNVHLEHKYNKVRFYMNKSGWISIDNLSSFYFEDYKSSTRQKKFLSRNHLTTCRV
jgi:hypothetical protein